MLSTSPALVVLILELLHQPPWTKVWQKEKHLTLGDVPAWCCRSDFGSVSEMFTVHQLKSTTALGLWRLFLILLFSLSCSFPCLLASLAMRSEDSAADSGPYWVPFPDHLCTAWVLANNRWQLTQPIFPFPCPLQPSESLEQPTERSRICFTGLLSGRVKNCLTLTTLCE